MPAIEVSELSYPPGNSSEARMLDGPRDVYNHGSTFTNVAGDAHYWIHGQNEPGPDLARPTAEPSSTSQSTELPSQLYSRLLLKKGRGYPLMDPTLPIELPTDCQSQGVMIGDVGVVSEDGYFDVLFNICEPADGSINSDGVPEGFVTLPKPPDNHHNYRRGRSYGIGGYTVSDPGIRVTSLPLGALMDYSDDYLYRFQCGSGEGAILALPLGASREDLLHRKDFLDYAIKHGVRWYEFVTQKLGRAIDNGSIYLITGFDKARCWGTASFPAGSALASSPIHFTKAGWRSYGPATVKHETNPGILNTPPENQCIFLRGYRVTLSNRILSKVFGASIAVEASPMERASPKNDRLSLSTLFNIGQDLATILGNMIHRDIAETSPSILCGDVDVDQPIVTPTTSALLSETHPSNLVNLYLLSKFPDSDLAVTHDSVWCSYLSLKLESERQNQNLAPFFEYLDARYTINQQTGAIYLVEPERSDEETDLPVPVPIGSSGPTPLTDEVPSTPTTITAVSPPARATDRSRAIEVLDNDRSDDNRGLRDEVSTDISERLKQLHLPVEDEPTTMPIAHSGSLVESTISNSHITPGRDMIMFSSNFTGNILINGAAAKNDQMASERRNHIYDEDDIASGMLIPAPPACILERDAQHTQIIDKLISTSNAKVAILGMGGIGKTTLACSVANDSQIIDAYSRRLFLSFEGCSTVDLAYTNLATAFQTPVDRRSSQSQILSHILNYLRQQKTLLIIDNFETFWEAPSNRRAAEDFLSHLAALRELAMIVTLRGIQRPGNICWVKIDPLRTLTPDASKELFAIITDGEYAEGDFEFIQRLLDAVAGIPRAVTLIGTLLRDESETPRSLWNQWTREGARAIRVANEGDFDDRLYKLDVSMDEVFSTPTTITAVSPPARAIEVLDNDRSDDNRGLRDEVSTDISERLKQLHLPVENEPTRMPIAHSGSLVESTISNSHITPGRDMNMFSYITGNLTKYEES